MTKRFTPAISAAQGGNVPLMVEDTLGGYVTVQDYNLLAKALLEVTTLLDSLGVAAAEGAANLRKAVAA